MDFGRFRVRVSVRPSVCLYIPVPGPLPRRETGHFLGFRYSQNVPSTHKIGQLFESSPVMSCLFWRFLEVDSRDRRLSLYLPPVTGGRGVI